MLIAVRVQFRYDVKGVVMLSPKVLPVLASADTTTAASEALAVAPDGGTVVECGGAGSSGPGNDTAASTFCWRARSLGPRQLPSVRSTIIVQSGMCSVCGVQSEVCYVQWYAVICVCSVQHAVR